MKKIVTKCLLGICFISIIGVFCIYRFVFYTPNSKTESRNELAEEQTYYEPTDENGVCYTYYKDENGKWCVNGKQYNERIVLEKKLFGAMVPTEYVVLTNNSDITFGEVHGSVCNNLSTNFKGNLYCRNKRRGNGYRLKKLCKV